MGCDHFHVVIVNISLNSAYIAIVCTDLTLFYVNMQSLVDVV